MIAMIQPLAAGNALKVILDVPADASALRLLRRVTDAFTGQDDPDAYLVSDVLERATLDSVSLVNGTLYYYRPYYFIGSDWSAGTTVSATPAATYEDRTSDVLDIVRERLDLGLQVEVARTTLTHEQGHIKVLTAPPVLEDTVWPVVTVHLTNEAPGERGVGEMSDEFEGDSNGWLARVSLTIMGWSLNPDERIELRKALRRIVLANMGLFDFAGMVEIEFSQQDTEDFNSFGAPVYQTLCTFSCLAPVVVGSDLGTAIDDVTITITE